MAIRAAFNGHNLDELARKHGISVRWARLIVTAAAAKK
jgi:Mor family transcriptional regulator